MRKKVVVEFWKKEKYTEEVVWEAICEALTLEKK